MSPYISDTGLVIGLAFTALIILAFYLGKAVGRDGAYGRGYRHAEYDFKLKHGLIPPMEESDVRRRGGPKSR